MMRYMVVTEQSPMSWGAYVPDLPGCAAVGKTKEEVLALIQKAIKFHYSEMDYVEVSVV